MNFTKTNNFVIDENDNTQTAEVIIRLTNWAARTRIMELKKEADCDLRVNLDLTKLRKEQLANYRQTLLTQNRRAFAFINNECKIVVNDCSNSEQKPKPIYIDSILHFNESIANIRIDAEFSARQRQRFNKQQ